MQLDPGALASGAPRVLKSTPEDAVVSLEATVLLMKFTASASCSETPPPSQPATLLAIMLLGTLMEYHGVEYVVAAPEADRMLVKPGTASPLVTDVLPLGKKANSAPSTSWKR